MKKLVLGAYVIFIATIVVFCLVSKAHAATFTVTDTGDASAVDPNVSCDTAGNVCTLRSAIEAANAQAGADTINFNIAGSGVHTITPNSLYPVLTDQVSINGETQGNPSYPTISPGGAQCGTLVPGLPSNSNTPHALQVEIDGGNLQGNNDDDAIFNIGTGANNSVIRGLIVKNAGGTNNDYVSAIIIGGPDGSTILNPLIECNYIGTNNTGSVAEGSFGRGIFLAPKNNRSDGAIIRNNVITSNREGQLYIHNHTNVSVTNNLIGVTASGNTALPPNEAPSYPPNNIGIYDSETITISNNVVSGAYSINTASGVAGNGITSISLHDNFIGLGLSGNAVGNNAAGVSIGVNDGAIYNNTIANNSQTGLLVYGNEININNNNIYNNSDGMYAGSQGGGANFFNVYSNNIHNNQQNGLVSTGYDGNLTIRDNNIFSNTQNGVQIRGTNITLHSNNIGLDSNDNPAGNGQDGVRLGIDSYFNNVGNIVIGSSNNAERNIISANSGNGVHITNNSCGGTIDNSVIGNYIGTNTSGTLGSGYGNGQSGVSINETIGDCSPPGSVYRNQIGGDEPGQANVIAGNGQDGVRVFHVPTGYQNNCDFGFGPTACTGSDVFNNPILKNTIYGNANLGINLATDNNNDGIADTDLGPNPLNNFAINYPASYANNFLNHPTILSSSYSGNQLTVKYNFQAPTITQSDDGYSLSPGDIVGYRLDFYINNHQDGTYSGYSQGLTHLGSFIVDGSESNASHTFISPSSLSESQNITVTTTTLWANIPQSVCDLGPGPHYGVGPPYNECHVNN